MDMKNGDGKLVGGDPSTTRYIGGFDISTSLVSSVVKL